jgi:hypothetical protein
MSSSVIFNSSRQLLPLFSKQLVVTSSSETSVILSRGYATHWNPKFKSLRAKKVVKVILKKNIHFLLIYLL